MAVRSLVLLVLLAACHPPGYGDDDPAPDAGPDASADQPDASPDSPDAEPAACQAAFRLEGHGTATSVWLTGDFVAWAGMPAAGAVELALGADTAWTGSRTFAAGSYLYKFIVDGSAWIADPGNPDGVDDGFGGTNSVYACTP